MDFFEPENDENTPLEYLAPKKARILPEFFSLLLTDIDISLSGIYNGRRTGKNERW
jgi:hypothetical protein